MNPFVETYSVWNWDERREGSAGAGVAAKEEADKRAASETLRDESNELARVEENELVVGRIVVDEGRASDGK